MEKRVLVIVPRGGKKRKMSLYLKDLGIYTIDIPHGLEFGDEFEVVIDQNIQLVPCQYEAVPVPVGIKPGFTFKTLMPNGKKTFCSCPPNVEEDDLLLIPWGDITEHMLVQPAKEKPKKRDFNPRSLGFDEEATMLKHALKLSKNTAFVTSKEDELLQRAIQQSKEVIQPTDDEILQAVLRESQMDDTLTDDDVLRFALEESRKPVFTSEDDILLQHALKESELAAKSTNFEDDELAQALMQSRLQAEQQSQAILSAYSNLGSSRGSHH